jgi:hypothetical protein
LLGGGTGAGIEPCTAARGGHDGEDAARRNRRCH